MVSSGAGDMHYLSDGIVPHRTGNMERIMKNQAYNRAGDSSSR